MMKTHAISAFLIFLTFILHVSLVFAQIDPVNRLSRVYSVERFRCLTCPEPETRESSLESNVFGLFDERTIIAGSVASQRSSFDESAISLSAEVKASMQGGEFGSTRAETRFKLLFNIQAASNFQLTGTLTETDIVQAGAGYDKGGAQLSLTGGSTNLMFESTPDVNTSFDMVVRLQPGQYTYEFFAWSSGNTIEPSAFTTSTSTLSFVNAVPEPSSLLLLATGIGGLIFRRRCPR